MIPIARHIPPQPWMSDENTLAVMAALSGMEEEPQALFVGGCVRNALLGLPVDDIDIATRLTPPEVSARLESAGIKAIPTGIEHGTITAVSGPRSFEITTLRRDVETDGRHAVVAFTGDWAEDAARRDFTMNTLLADTAGNIYDPTGEGLDDLEARRIVFVGAPAQRIAEDYLRILRFFRFYAVYGIGAPDESALEACREAADKIATLSRERVTQEFLKILAAGEPSRILELMFGNGVLADLPCTNYSPAILGRLAALQEQYGVINVVARLLPLIESPEAAERYLLLSNAQKNAFSAIGKATEQAASGAAQAMKKLVYLCGQEIATQALLVDAARRDAEIDLSQLRSWQAPSFPLKGDDVLAAGVGAGPQVGAVLHDVEQWWMDRDFTPDRAACLEQMKYVLARMKKGPA